MFLLLVVGRHITGGVLQADGRLAMISHALSSCLVVLVEAHFLVSDDAVHVVPRPANHRAEKSDGVLEGGGARQPVGPHLLEAFLL